MNHPPIENFRPAASSSSPRTQRPFRLAMLVGSLIWLAILTILEVITVIKAGPDSLLFTLVICFIPYGIAMFALFVLDHATQK